MRFLNGGSGRFGMRFPNEGSDCFGRLFSLERASRASTGKCLV